MTRKQDPNADFKVAFITGWNAAVKTIAAACDEQINRSGARVNRGALYAEVADHVRKLEKPYD